MALPQSSGVGCEEINIGSWKDDDPCYVVAQYLGKLLLLITRQEGHLSNEFAML